MNVLSFAEDPDVFQTVAGYCGNALALFFFLTPAVGMYALIKGKIDKNGIPYILLIASIMNCILWFVYGLRIPQFLIYLCNGLGMSFSLIYLTIYWYFFVDKKIINFILITIGTYAFLFGIFAICYWVIPEDNKGLVGNFAMAFNIIMYAAPGQKIVK